MTLHVRISDGAAGVVSRVREEVQRIDKDMPLFAIHTLADQMNSLLSRERLVAALSLLFGLLALLLASVGLYGLMAFTVVQRTGEMGLRMALGAGQGTVLRLVMREALVLVLIGLVIGVPCARIAGRLAASQNFRTTLWLERNRPRHDVWRNSGARGRSRHRCLLPAARASRVDPMVALRND